MEIDFTKLHVLVVDDHPGMRTSIRTTLSNFGVTKTDMASTAFDAARRIRQAEAPYELIVCDYNLGDGRDGQQLLEELRLGKLIPMSTVFLIVTAERAYEKVMSAAELAPDDYLIKPFTAEALMQRLTKVLQKKGVFAPVYSMMDGGRVEVAIAQCDHIIATHSNYTIDAIRLKAELLLAIGHLDEGQALYEKVIAMRPVPWARMGRARALFLLGRLAEAEQDLIALTDAAPDFLSAFDLLARVQEARGDAGGAQATLQRATARSPNTLARQKVLGELALANGQLDVAEQAFKTVVEKGTHSILRSPEDHGRLARVQIDQGKLTEAGNTLKDLRQQYHNSPEAEFTALVVEGLKETRAGHPEAAGIAVANALKLRQEHGLAPSQGLTLDLARACLSTGKEEEGKALLTGLINDDHEDEQLINKTRALFADLGRPDEGEALVQSSVRAAVALNNEAVSLARQGDLAGAVELLIRAATDLPNNPQILLNAAQAILTLLKQTGWDPDKADLARRYLSRAKQRKPDHPKVAKVIGLFRDLSQKYAATKGE